MAINNSQYGEIMRAYQSVQLRNRSIQKQRREEVIGRAPRLKEIENEISSRSIAAARKRLGGDTKAQQSLHREIEELCRERAELLNQLHLPPRYLEPIYDCPDCKDTGYIGSEKCHCFKQAIIDAVYSQSNMRQILQRENFKTFSYSYYSDQIINPATGLSSLATMKKAVETCTDFIKNFEEKPKNLFLYGDTGVGKTFLSNCVAKELLDRGYSVVYLTAFQMFDILSRRVFDRDADAIDANRNIFDCDLLIIDDLGTELANSFTTSQLFLCVNERILRQKSTIISTNLGLNQILDTYSERTFSRLTSNYSMIKLFGDDIRLKKRLQ